MKKEINIMRMNHALNLVRPSSRAKKLDSKQEMNAVGLNASDPIAPTPVKFPLIRNAIPSRITVLKPDISRMAYSKGEESKTRGPLDLLSTFLSGCFKGIIALAAIYVSIDFGCWNKTYLEPIENDLEKTEPSEEIENAEWDMIANYIAGRA